MKRIFIITLALCLGACASQPEKPVTADQLASQSTDQTQPTKAASERSTERVYLDDFQRLPFPDRRREVRVLRGNKG